MPQAAVQPQVCACASCLSLQRANQFSAQGGSQPPIYHETGVPVAAAPVYANPQHAPQSEVYSPTAFQPQQSVVVPSHGPIQAVNYAALSQSARQTPMGVAQQAHSGQLPMQHQQQTQPQPRTSLHTVVPLAAGQYPRSEYDAISLQNGLHLAHLRSPPRTPRASDRSQYFQYVSHFAVAPMEVLPRRGIRVLEFNLTGAEAALAVSAEKDLRPVYFSNGSTRYRLRACKFKRDAAGVDTSVWATRSTSWPATVFLEFNGEPVFPRRRPHAHTDQPIELTGMLRPGLNQVRVSLPSTVGKGLEEPFTFLMAVEVVTTSEYTTLLTQVIERQHFSIEDTKTVLRRRLKGADSDDIIIQDKTLHIGIADPFSSSLFAIPVRGIDCKHLECFDLEIWLQTREGKPSKVAGEPSLVDGWKCPICSLDARPVSLRVDDYFANVRANIIASGVDATEAKSIIVHNNGDWTLVKESDDKRGNDLPGSRAQEMPHPERNRLKDLAAESPIILDD